MGRLLPSAQGNTFHAEATSVDFTPCNGAVEHLTRGLLVRSWRVVSVGRLSVQFEAIWRGPSHPFQSLATR